MVGEEHGQTAQQIDARELEPLLEALCAAANGEVGVRVSTRKPGMIGELARAINELAERREKTTREIVRVGRLVGRDGRLAERAELDGAAGTWAESLESLNAMIDNLVRPTTEVARVIDGIAKGDLSQKIAFTIDGQAVRGEFRRIATIVNGMVDQLATFAEEVTRVAREVGTEGKLGGQARVKGASGVWKDLTDNVNQLADNLTTQVRNIAEVTTAVAQGDLSRKITVDVRGEIAQLKTTINTMVDQLSSFADEVTRVAREVGTEGKLGGQAEVRGVSGVWKDLTDNVNFMASSLTEQVRNIATVTTAVANGDLSKKVTANVRGEIAELKDTINTMVDQLRSFAAEVTRVAREVGSEGKLGGQAHVEGVSGTWKDLTDNVNFMATSLTEQVRNIAAVTTAVAMGDLTKKVTVDVRGEIAELKATINTMVDQLSTFADEVTRVAREVGTEGKLGGQARVKGVSGTWKDLTDNVNQLADNLTTQVRAIAEVTTAVAQGDLSQKIAVDARGEVAELKNTINKMVDQLSIFADEVTRVAKEVGTEGNLGVQARVKGVSGTWKDLTDNVNQLAQTLTTQLRAIAEVSTAVTQGDLSRAIAVEAAGEVAELKDTINEMIARLRETTLRNAEQDWLNSNLARFSGMLQGQRDLTEVSRLIMSELTPLVRAQHGGFFLREEDELRLVATYGYKQRKGISNRFALGEGLVGQAALEGRSIAVGEPPADYVRIGSGLGEGVPRSIVVLPVPFEDRVMGVIELASFEEFTAVQRTFLDQLAETIGVVINTIQATMRTEQLLEQSQQLAQELQSQSEQLQAQQEELRQTNEDLEQQARSLRASEELLQQQQEELQTTNEELEEKAALLEEKNQQIEEARRSLEEKAEQLALSSRYKSEFLANMSHELRTPLNSLLILAKLLADNPEGNLTEKQIEFSETIHTAGTDLLNLINDILDLSKIEAGKMDVHPADLELTRVRSYAERTFRPLAEEKGLEFEIVLADSLPETIVTDEQRLLQILRNLLSNAFKFTDTGRVELRLEPARDDRVAFAVADTGIGIPPGSLNLVFEAFQQADGSTGRRYGGTGLGLSISREVARLLGGEIRASSEVGRGSTFTLSVPRGYSAPPEELVPTAALPELDPSALLPGAVPDDRDELAPGDRVVLIVEEDPELAGTVLDTARERGFKAVVAERGDTGLALANELRPDAVVLDAELPGLNGWELLERLKHNPETRHIPVHVVSAREENGRRAALRAGAIAFLEKPVTADALASAFSDLQGFIDRGVRRLLVVEDDLLQQQAIQELIGGEDTEVVGVGSGDEALERLAEERFDCMVLDLKLRDKTGFQLLEQVKEDERFRDLPIIVYTGKELTRAEESQLRKYAEAIVVKGASSPERLLDETSLFLHRVERDLPQEKRRMLEHLHDSEAVFQDKRVLIADDDVRNVFALTSVLEERGMEVRYAENGREALELLEAEPEVDLVLMDIMMPELDGYEAMRRLREDERFARLPVIALTAKAMRGDREKSIAAGASDYITKPVDTDQLLSLMRVWLYS